MNSKGRVAGKIAIVTGAAGVLGAAQATMLASEGAVTIMADIDLQKGQALADDLVAQGLSVQFHALDVTSAANWDALVHAVEAEWGRIDILVNNAGTNLPRATIDERREDEWDRLMDINAKSVFLGTRVVIPGMRRAGKGAIVNIASMAALGLSAMMEATYVATKGAVHSFTRATAAQHGRDGIRCNAVYPGPIDSEMLRGYYSNPALKAERLSHVPLGRFGDPQDVAAAVLFLASDEAAYITGAQLVVDGGSLVN